MRLSVLNKLHTIFAVVFIASSNAYAQFATANFPTLEKKEIWYDEIVGRESAELINGSEYFITFQGGPTHPFFGNLSDANGKLWYDGQYFPNVKLMYDIYTDMLVIRHRDKEGMFSMINLDQSKVRSFTLNSHYFTKLTNSRALAGHPDNGYYDVLFKGKHLTLVAKRIKRESNSTSIVEYKLDDQYFFINDGKWSSIRGLNDVTALDKSRSQEIIKFVKSAHIKLRKLNEAEIQAVAGYCDALLTMGSSR